jgi:hypothetical protein
MRIQRTVFAPEPSRQTSPITRKGLEGRADTSPGRVIQAKGAGLLYRGRLAVKGVECEQSAVA